MLVINEYLNTFTSDKHSWWVYTFLSSVQNLWTFFCQYFLDILIITDQTASYFILGNSMRILYPYMHSSCQGHWIFLRRYGTVWWKSFLQLNIFWFESFLRQNIVKDMAKVLQKKGKTVPLTPKTTWVGPLNHTPFIYSPPIFVEVSWKKTTNL